MYHSDYTGKNPDQKPIPLAIKLENIPQALKEKPHWVMWRYEYVSGKWTKVPFTPHKDIGGFRTGVSRASSIDPTTWGIIEDAIACLPSYNGIGFMLQGSGFTGIDIDKCINSGVITETAQAIIREVNSYTELSPSAHGIRALVIGKVPTALKRPEIELYDTARYLTITGHRLETAPLVINERQTALDSLYERYKPARQESSFQKSDFSPRVEDDDIITRASGAKNGEKFKALYERGDTSDYNEDDSAADLALISILAFWTQDEEQLVRLFSRSALNRDKWERRADYRESTIRFALNGLEETWKGDKESERHKLSDAAEEIVKPFQSEPAQEPEKTASNLQKILKWDDIDIRGSIPIDWMIEKILPLGSLSLVSGLPLSGKTTILSHAMVKVAEGSDWFGRTVTRTPVVYLNADQQSYQLVRSRLLPHIAAREKLNEMFRCPSFAEMPLPLPEKYCETIINLIGPTGWLIIDTLRSAFLVGADAGTENDTAIIKYLQPLRKLVSTNPGWHITLVHHNSRGKDEYAGSGAIAGTMDCMINVSKDRESNTSRIHVHNRHGTNLSMEIMRNEDGTLVGIDASKVKHSFAINLPSTPPGISIDEMMDLPYVQMKQFSHRCVEEKVGECYKLGIIERAGGGKRGSPFTYWHKG